MTAAKVLIPLDGSAFSLQILPYVRRILNPDEYELTLLQVVEKPGHLGDEIYETIPVPALEHYLPAKPQTARMRHPIYASQELDTLLAIHRGKLESQARSLREAGYRVAVEVRLGEPAPEIEGFVEGEGVDLIAMTTHGRSGLRRLVSGSIAEQVIRNVSVPILLLRPVW